jgi:hypothetical protein
MTTATGTTANEAAALLEELAGLVRLAARRGDLVVREGQPRCDWSFDWQRGVITVNPRDLRSLAPDLCRGLALHEAAHAAVTVVQDIVDPLQLARLLPLLNVIEDIRIEVWMRSRFPGAAPWIRAYNDVLYGLARREALPRSRQAQFLRGVLERWWYGAATTGMRPEVTAALDECHEPIAAAVACQPPRDDDPAGVQAAQQAMWEIMRQRIVPVWQRLVLLDRRDGLGELSERELQAFARHLGCRSPAASGAGPIRRRLCRAARAAGARATRRTHDRLTTPGDGKPGAGSPDSDSEAVGHAGNDTYLSAWKRIAGVSDRLGDELLRRLLPQQRLGWTSGHPSGTRLDLRQAARFDADPTLYQSLWSRPVLPKRRDPAVLLLVDRSGSMDNGERMERAFEGLVLLVEVCRRIGVPAAVWSFAESCREELGWDTPLDAATRQRLGNLPGSCNGMTHMAPALDAVRLALAARRADPQLLFVLSDGGPDRPSDTRAAVQRLDAVGVGTIGLGLGADTTGLADYFERAVTGIQPERLVDHVGSLLESALAHVHGA